MALLTFHTKNETANSTSYFFGNDPYMESFWLGFLGPTSISLLNYLSIKSLICAPWFDIESSELSRQLGTGQRSGSSSPIMKQLHRLSSFKLIDRYNESTFLISAWYPKLSDSLISKLPVSEQNRHYKWIVGLEENPLQTFRHRITHLISTMQLMGIASKEISLALMNTGIHPSIIGEYIKAIDKNNNAA